MLDSLDAPTAIASHRFGCVIIKRTVKKARMNFSHVLRQTVKMASLVVVDMNSTKHIVCRRTTNAT